MAGSFGVFLFGNICAIGKRQRTIFEGLGSGIHTWELCLRADRGGLPSSSCCSQTGSQVLSVVLKAKISAPASRSGS